LRKIATSVILGIVNGIFMKPINKDELYEHLSGFLRARGVELKPGSYTQGIQKGCGLLTDTINLSQRGIQKARVQLDKKLDQMRQVIHEKTAPKQPGAAPRAAASGPAAQANNRKSAPKARKSASTKSKPRSKKD
jgi:hypothetical protein